jgi:hypothetical protein
MDFKELHLFLFLYNQAILRKQKSFSIKFSINLEKILKLLLKKNFILGFVISSNKLIIFLKYYKFKHVFYKLQSFSFKKRPLYHKSAFLLSNSVYFTTAGFFFSEDLQERGGLHLFQIIY